MDRDTAKFLKVYSKLPKELIDQIVVYVEGKPYSWEAIYFEIKNETPMSKKILNTLSAMGLI